MLKKVASVIMVLALVLCFVPVYFSVAADDTAGKAPTPVVYKNTKCEIVATYASDGYIIVRYLNKSDKVLKVTIETTVNTYTYDLRQDAVAETYPLQMGDGKYTVKVLENTSGTKYSVSMKQEIDVKLKSANAPFLISHQYVNYTDKSKVVAKSNELTKDAKDAFEKVSLVYDYIISNISYDKDKAATVKSGYVPNADKIIESAKGICFDYAAVLCSMLRPLGIPTKMVFGYVAPDNLYHAWNEVFIDGVGWVKVGGETYFDGKKWSRMDPTFAASKSASASKFIGDGSNYSTAKYIY